MKKFGSWALLGVGAFLVVTALVARLWGLPAAERTPLDTDTETLLSGEASGVVVQVGDGEPQPVVAKNVTRADSEASDDDVVVFAATTCLTVDEDLEGTDYCVGGDDLRTVTISADVFATDRRDGEAVENGDYVGGDYGQKEGLVNKWPFGAEKKDYEIWDDVLDRAVTATYEGVERIDGLETYKYVYSVDGEETEIADGTDGTYSQTKEYWVDPGTGSIINQTQEEERLTEDGATALSLSLAYTDETVQNNVDTAKDNNRLLTIIGGWIPLGGGILGVLALGGAALLMTREGKRGDRVA
ncbi:DUF3068 domain-containing protein [Nocardioides zeae]|uniref:DUF3068 domain-containing protein n=1 Tax=Nocardioides imazamoxiresistens TaxID=3231893 RepID=A0ABU3PZ69_9ACTN|nr:DUF3068 domain-containing protein [Nocardioides zeae]MDT9594560.1 DUF3068 domain-containing protein [Nocardioides zeae]